MQRRWLLSAMFVVMMLAPSGCRQPRYGCYDGSCGVPTTATAYDKYAAKEREEQAGDHSVAEFQQEDATLR